MDIAIKSDDERTIKLHTNLLGHIGDTLVFQMTHMAPDETLDFVEAELSRRLACEVRVIASFAQYIGYIAPLSDKEEQTYA